MGLYAEQLSGTPFTFAKTKNQRSWTYRIQPTVKHGAWQNFEEFSPKERNFHYFAEFDRDENMQMCPRQRRWTPQDYLDCDFIRGIRTMMGAGTP